MSMQGHKALVYVSCDIIGICTIQVVAYSIIAVFIAFMHMPYYTVQRGFKVNQLLP